MRARRLFHPVSVPDFPLDPESSHYLERVLRLRPGDCFEALDGGMVHRCRLLEGSRGLLLESAPGTREPSIRIRLALALVKGERFDHAVEMAAELGVMEIVPLRSRNCVVECPGETRRQRWQRIARSGAALAGRAVAPTVAAPCPFEEALLGPAVVFCPGYPPLRELPDGELSLFIGPEGGFSPDEVEEARLRGAGLAGLGDRILRVETAAAVAVTLVLRLAGDL
ncbi:MAG: RsmE family RNA methyltransferase [Candidatus Eremiobacterota bacterium]